jgi:hypothetical protein
MDRQSKDRGGQSKRFGSIGESLKMAPMQHRDRSMHGMGDAKKQDEDDGLLVS